MRVRHAGLRFAKKQRSAGKPWFKKHCSCILPPAVKVPLVAARQGCVQRVGIVCFPSHILLGSPASALASLRDTCVRHASEFTSCKARPSSPGPTSSLLSLQRICLHVRGTRRSAWSPCPCPRAPLDISSWRHGPRCSSREPWHRLCDLQGKLPSRAKSSP